MLWIFMPVRAGRKRSSATIGRKWFPQQGHSR
jgi:hypothetical protein